MKSQKRDRTGRAFVRGYHAGIAGKSKSSCPHEGHEEIRRAWLAGWREGRSDHWEGVDDKYAAVG